LALFSPAGRRRPVFQIPGRTRIWRSVHEVLQVGLPAGLRPGAAASASG
jgi:hypothetical protein